tara:strand:+ start:1208 stop:1741 length:534 start_codon:yes stop_codon:yes gene_type:complete
VAAPAESNAQEKKDIIIMDAKDFREQIVQPTLKFMNKYIPGMNSEAAENLMVGTAIMESDISYLVQKNGPALGVYQVEPATFIDITQRYFGSSQFRAEFASMFWDLGYTGTTNEEHLIFDLRYATIIARIKYFMSPKPLPDAEDIHALGHYWDDNYNGNPDVGTADQWEAKYRKAHE